LWNAYKIIIYFLQGNHFGVSIKLLPKFIKLLPKFLTIHARSLNLCSTSEVYLVKDCKNQYGWILFNKDD